MILYVSCCYYFMFSNDGLHYSLVRFFTSKSNLSWDPFVVVVVVFKWRVVAHWFCFAFMFAVLCLLCLIVLLTAVIILCRHLFCPHRDSAACRKGPLAMAMASLSKTFSESRTRIIGWSVARSVLADDISQTLVKILPDRKLWKRLQRSKTWSALIFDDQLFFFV